jgi:CRP-like cAMP-binding protein
MLHAYLSRNNTGAAVKLLFEMIVESAKSKDFRRAEALRARLLEVDPLALTEIIKSAEIIEEEKSHALDEGHLSIWSDLYSRLSPEEGHALYFALQTGVWEATQTVFGQGEQHSRLYFVNRGDLALLWREGRREVVLGKIGSGQIAAADGFFSESVCTISLAALSHAELGYLEKEVLLEWEKEFPSLEDKLREYCRKTRDTAALLKEHGVERRCFHRLPVSGSLTVQLMSGAGNPVAKPFRGDITDISDGGTAFFVNLRDRKTARALLGRDALLSIPVPGSEPRMDIHGKGHIVAIHHVPYEGYCLHVRFEEALSREETATLRLLPGRQRTTS